MTTLILAAQQALEVLEWHLDRGTWGADLEGCVANLRAALEQEQAEPVQEPVGWRIRAVGSMGWRGPWRAYWQSARPGVNEPEFCEFVALYTAPPPCPTAELRAVAAEREECAFVAEDWDNDSADPRDIAAAIRARGTS